MIYSAILFTINQNFQKPPIKMKAKSKKKCFSNFVTQDINLTATEVEENLCDKENKYIQGRVQMQPVVLPQSPFHV